MRPLVSCIVPTTEARRPWLEQVARCFDRQADGDGAELILVDDGDIAHWGPDSDTLHVKPGLTIGAKMNLGCQEARGDVLIKWDDDDFYSPTFTASMVSALAGRDGCVAAVGTYLTFILEDWKLRWSGGANAFAGATLCFTKETWRKRPFNEHLVVGEDLDFSLAHQLNRIPVFPPPHNFVAVRHRGNTWREWQGGSVEDVFRKRPEFEQTPEAFFPPADLAFYRRMARR